MSVREIFAQRFSLLRAKHELSFSDMAKLLGLKNKVAVHHWEKSQKGFPSEEALVLISNLFGVSLDWLFGRTRQPYNSDIILDLEEFVLTILKDTIHSLPAEYMDVSSRESMYSLPVRANIIFLVSKAYLEATIETVGLERITSIDGEELPNLNDTVIIVNRTQIKILDSQALRLISRQLTVPFYDIAG